MVGKQGSLGQNHPKKAGCEMKDIEQYADTALQILQYLCYFVAGLGPVIALVKRWTGDPKPTDSAAKQKWFKALAIADVAAANSSTVADKLKKMQLKEKLITQAMVMNAQPEPVVMPPPKPLPTADTIAAPAPKPEVKS